MKTKSSFENGIWTRIGKQITAAAAVLLLPLAAWASGVVFNCAEADLRAALTGGGTAKFACGGTITLSSTITVSNDTVLDASGQQVTISGGDAVRVFCVQSNVTFSVNHLTIAHGRSTNGAGIFDDHGTVNVSDVTFDGNAALGAAGPIFGQGAPGQSVGGGGSSGSGLHNVGSANVVNCTFAANKLIGGNGGTGGRAGVFSWGSHGGAIGFPGGNGGSGGGAFDTLSGGEVPLHINNCTVAFNSALGGLGGPGGSGTLGQPGGGFGPAGTAASGISPANIVNSLLASNGPSGSCSGPLTDLGHNLSSDSSCAFTNVGSLNNVDPQLAPLASNGGPTLTMALLPGSPAIDAGDTAAAPSTDQRGFPRPAGSAADIGAYEFGSPALLLLSRAPQGGLDIVFYGANLPCCRLQCSTNLVDWVDAATNQPVTSGTVLYHDDCQDSGGRFYRAIIP